MIVFWVGAGAGLLAGWVCGWAVTSWWRDRHEAIGFGQEDDESAPPEDLPPERSREELGFTADLYEAYAADLRVGPAELEFWHDVAQERRAPWWEAEHRAAYESLGFDYPSGLMTRVRELTP